MFWILACAQKEELPPPSPVKPQSSQVINEAPAQSEPQKIETLSSDITVSGFSTPESVLYDPNYDRYIVSNINGGPLDKDDNGFISLVSPQGKITELEWISGASELYELHAPKGTALVDNELYVADIDTIRVFDLNSGAHIRNISIEGAQFLNDLHAAGSSVFCSDMNTGIIHQLKQGKQLSVFKHGLSSPNGIAARGQSIYITSFKDPSVVQLKMDGSTVEASTFPASGLDGIVMTLDGTSYVSSWDSSSIYRRSPANKIEPLLTDIDAPADIGWDSKRNRLLVPLFKQNELLFVSTSSTER